MRDGGETRISLPLHPGYRSRSSVQLTDPGEIAFGVITPQAGDPVTTRFAVEAKRLPQGVLDARLRGHDRDKRRAKTHDRQADANRARRAECP
jgi:hypothetical protein